MTNQSAQKDNSGAAAGQIIPHCHFHELAKLKYFAGMTNEEVSEVMGVSVATVKNYWTFSRAWLLNEIDQD